jgi:hypothetical protein
MEHLVNLAYLRSLVNLDDLAYLVNRIL